MEVRPPKDRVLIEAASSNSEYLVRTETNLADHVLVVGERYQPVDFKTLPAVHLGNFTSGVMRKEDNCAIKRCQLLTVLISFRNQSWKEDRLEDKRQ